MREVIIADCAAKNVRPVASPSQGISALRPSHLESEFLS